MKYPQYLWTAYNLNPVAELRFAPPRKWRFDFAFVKEQYAVEIEGAIWTRGRHTRGSGYLADMEKYNAAAALKWFVYRFTPQQFKVGEAQVFMLNVLKQ